MVIRVGQPLRWLGGKLDVRVRVATGLEEGGALWDQGVWDEAVWSSSELAWQDISQYVMRVRYRAGQERWDTRFQAGTLTLELDNTDGLFTPNVAPHMWGLPFRPGRVVQLVVFPDPDQPELGVPLFTGRIQSLTDVFDEGGTDIRTLVYAADFLADLHANNPPALEVATGVQSTDARVHAALDYAEIPVEQRDVQIGEHTMQTSFLAQTTLEECQRAADAEGGAFYCDGRGTFVFRARDWLVGGSVTMDSYEAQVLLLQPVAYWRMGDDTDETVDSTGNGHTLTWAGSPTTGVVGVEPDDEAVSLDGTDDEATAASPSALVEVSDKTIEMWVKPTGGGTIVQASDQDGSTGDSFYRVYVESSGDLRVFWFESESALLMSGVFVPFDEWTHVVVTIAETRTELFLNGVSRGVTNHGWGEQGTTPTRFKIGNVVEATFMTDDFFEGEISELVIYGTALSSEAVRLLYEAKDRQLNTRSTEVQGYLGYEEEQEAGKPHAQFSEISTSWELARVRNSIRFARTGGEVQLVEDESSVILHGRRTYQRLDLNNNQDSEVLFLAERMLEAEKDSRVRVESVTIVANDDPENEDLNRLFYDTRFGDLLAINVATQHGWGFEELTHVTGVVHDITPDDWRVTFTLDDSLVEEDE